jgi:CRP-like cAMP-binding protein
MNNLKVVPMFQNLSDDMVDEIWHRGKVVKYNKNEECFQAREKINCIFFLLSGIVAIYNLTHCGKKKTIFYLGAGELLNDCIIPDGIVSMNGKTVVECDIFVIRAEVFNQLMEKNFQLSQAAIKQLERKIWRMGHQLKNTMGSIYMDRKLAAKLWKLGRDFGKYDKRGLYIDIPLTITDLADFLGAPRETTSRICKLLCSYQLIEMKHKKIYILSADKLSDFYKKGVIPKS